LQRVHGVPGAFVLIACVEPAAGESQQLRLEVDRDDVDGPAGGTNPGSQRGSPEVANRGALVVDLDGRESVGEVANLVEVAQLGPGEEPDADAAAVGVGERGVPVSVEEGAEVLERVGVQDLLDGEYIRVEISDGRSERVQLRFISDLVVRGA
jgi:hypothetical protein